MLAMLNGIDIYGVKMMYDDQPISKVLWVDVNEIEANNYNPNSVAKAEMR